MVNLTETEMETALMRAKRKAELAGMNEDYARLVLPDVIKEMRFSRFTVELAETMMELRRA